MPEALFADIRYALRGLVARPGYALLVVLTLGLGIGANTAIFSAVDSLLLSDPPFADPDRLVRITSVRGDEDGGALAVPELDDLRALPVVEDAAMYTDQGMYNASGFGTPEELQATITTHDLFRVLGVQPVVGATFPATFDRTRNFGLVISHGLWVRRFNSDPGIVGRGMTLDGSPGYTIYGVLPPGFNFPSHSDLFRSSGISADPAYYARRDARDRFVVARLRAGVTTEQARAAIDDLARRLEREFPASNAGVRFQVTPLRDMYTAQMRPYVLLLFGAVALVLLVACTNVANLLLSRAIARERDTAVRTALGAGRWRLVRLHIAESLLLGTGGALVGGVLALAGIRLLTALVPVQLPPWMEVRADGRVGLFLAVVTLLTALGTGLVPAFRSRTNPYASLKDGARGSSEGESQQRLRRALVVAEVALALVLMIGAALMLQSVWRLHRVDLGYDTTDALTFRVELGWAAYGTHGKTTAFHDRVLEQLRALPGVRAVTFDANLPMSGKPRDPGTVRAIGQSVDEATGNPYVHGHLVGPDYFDVMGMGLRAGRSFDTRDRPGTTPVVVVSARLAERLWPGQDAVGRQIQIGSVSDDAVRYTVIGVSAPVLHHELDGAPGFDLYRPYTQISTAGPYYVIRTTGDPMAVAARATAIIGETDPNQSFLDVQTYERRVGARIWQRRLAGALFGSFAALAIVLAAIGLYGVLSYMVSQQTREIGVRLALGATTGGIVSGVLRRGLTLASLGVAFGVVVAFGLARLLAGLLYEVTPADPLTFVGVPVLLLIIAAISCYAPARRATRVDPIVALRAD